MPSSGLSHVALCWCTVCHFCQNPDRSILMYASWKDKSSKCVLLSSCGLQISYLKTLWICAVPGDWDFRWYLHIWCVFSLRPLISAFEVGKQSGFWWPSVNVFMPVPLVQTQPKSELFEVLTLLWSFTFMCKRRL